jgi:hypothetical protein
MKYFAILIFLAGLIGMGAFGETSAAKQPLYVYVYARVTDHVNGAIAEDQLRRLLPKIENYRKSHPGAHLSATVLFSGAASDALEKRNSQTHIADFVRDYIRRGLIDPGYDGADEPTYEHRPTLEFANTKTAEDRWVMRRAAAERLLAEARDPLTGAPLTGQDGGLKRMQAVFGNATAVSGLTLWIAGLPARVATGVEAQQDPKTKNVQANILPNIDTGLQPEVGGDSEIVQSLPRYTIAPVFFGIADTNPWYLPGFRGSRAGFSRIIGPAANTAPEIYWQDNILRTSEASDNEMRLVHANLGVEAIKTLAGKADRSKVHVIHVEVASEQNYLQPAFAKGENYPPLKYAYAHPDKPNLPEEALLPKADVEKAYAKEDEVLAWLTDEFFPSDHVSRFVSNEDLIHLVEPSAGFTISMEGLRAGYADFLKKAGRDTYLPPLFLADGHYLSLADVFQVSADALAEFHWHGKFPPSMKVVKTYGPVRIYTGHGVNEGEVSVASIAKVCADIDPSLRDKSPGPIPKNAIPSLETVDGIQVNSAQFVRLMGQAILDPTPEKKIPVWMTYMITAPGQVMPKMRILSDIGFVWTIKPAVFEPAKENRLAAK